MNENHEYNGSIAEGGLIHVHTEMSEDAILSLEEIGEYMRDHLRSEYFVVNDHLTSPYKGKSYSEAEIQEIIEEMLSRIAQYNESHDRPKCVSGIEANIITDGIDIPDALLAKIDFVIASRHFPWGNENPAQITQNLISAMANPNIDAVGHINSYVDQPIDWNLIFQTAENTNTIIEINFNEPPSTEILRIMSKYKIMYSIGVDFHTFQGLKNRIPIDSDVVIDFAEAKRMAKSQEDVAIKMKQQYMDEPVGFDVLKQLINLMKQLEYHGISLDKVVNVRSLDSFLALIKTPKSQRIL
ncbi:MAG: hypothetical protein WC451_02415 [Patescibacteria group bacterium]